MSTAKEAVEKFADRFKNGTVAVRLRFTDSNDILAYIYCRTNKGLLAVITITDTNGNPMPRDFQITFFDNGKDFDQHHAEHWPRSEALLMSSDEPIIFEFTHEKRHNGLCYPMQPTARKLVWQGFLLGLVNARIPSSRKKELDLLQSVSKQLEACALGSAFQKEKYGFD